MVKKIRLFGMEIDNYPLWEEIRLGESFYEQGKMNVIRTVSMQMLGMSVEDRQVQEGIGKADLVVIEDKEILSEAGIRSSQRLREADEHGFMQEFLKRACKNRRRVFLVAGDAEKLKEVKEFLQKAYEKMQIAGNYTAEDCRGGYDGMVNEINACAPDMILSVLESPVEDQLLSEAGARIDARVWYSMGLHYGRPAGRLPLRLFLRQLIHIGRFQTAVHQYRENHE